MNKKRIMKGNALWTILLLFILISAFSLFVNADDEEMGEIMGSFKVDLPGSVSIKSDEYVPIDEVARTMESQLYWELKGGKIEGSFGGIRFSSDKFVLANGQLYLPVNIFMDNFGIHIIIKGDSYHIYKKPKHDYYYSSDLELVINTNKDRYKRNENLAVSILLLNKGKRDIRLQYPSSQRYDLVLMRYNREVWRLSSGKGYLTSVGSSTLRPDEYQLYTELINPSKDAHIYYGTYQLYAEVKTLYGGTIRSKTLDIRFE
ncbi:MAG: hypothetical protein GX175_03040 [Halanaerobiaceae bacterium]|nr:hypothetical protein [Halanaerobiaceae bacterium]